ncbi:MAG: translocation/assembly module TamB domain-containing protein [Flavobacteriaceae bacterium]|nr:translocation/assembly module TamB domain-containing protein [Flavobacteriaceae bacterium]
MILLKIPKYYYTIRPLIFGLLLSRTQKWVRKEVLGGKIKHENFEKWFMDIFVSSDNLLVLDTEEYEDALYYGTGLIKGETTIYGPTDNLFIDVQATTNKGTQFIIPLSDVSTVGQSNLIHFVNPFEEELEDEYQKLVLMQQMKGLESELQFKCHQRCGS